MHAWEALRAADSESGDRVLGTALDVFVLLVSRDPRDLHELANRGNLVPMLLEKLAKLTRKNDPLCILNGAENDMVLKQKGFSRTDKLPVRISLAVLSIAQGIHSSAQLSSLEKVVTKSSIFPGGTPVTLPLYSLLQSELKSIPGIQPPARGIRISHHPTPPPPFFAHTHDIACTEIRTLFHIISHLWLHHWPSTSSTSSYYRFRCSVVFMRGVLLEAPRVISPRTVGP